MTDREYLRSLGFTVGERGRFSKEMLEALVNRQNAAVAESVNHAREVMGLPRIQEAPVRPAQELYGLTKDGYKVGFIMCSACAEHMMWCQCEGGVVAPDNVFTLTGAAKHIAQPHTRVLPLTTH